MSHVIDQMDFDMEVLIFQYWYSNMIKPNIKDISESFRILLSMKKWKEWKGKLSYLQVISENYIEGVDFIVVRRFRASQAGIDRDIMWIFL